MHSSDKQTMRCMSGIEKASTTIKGHTFPGRRCADCEPPVGEFVVDKDATAQRCKGEWQPQQSCPQRDVYGQIPPVWGSLPVQLLVPVVIGLCRFRLGLCKASKGIGNQLQDLCFVPHQEHRVLSIIFGYAGPSGMPWKGL